LFGEITACETHTRPSSWYVRVPREFNAWKVPRCARWKESFARRGYRQWYALSFRRVVGPSRLAIAENIATDLQFRALADEWRTETRFASSTTQMFLLASYQRIIGLGPRVIPAILRALQREPDHWFWALAALTGENPVRPEDAGNVHAMRGAWIEWGRQRGYL